ncbi:pentapeptide repeat-containing protein [Hahella aquimaris]|uniref:pentapeptide repeat-containing protein n=1 Tax=Hahella sp. HNIBRBA332 TaxID=3015983 RepID=UPI00352CC074
MTLSRQKYSTPSLHVRIFRDSNFSGVELFGSTFVNVRGEAINFSNSIITDTCFNGSNLKKASFCGARLSNVDVSVCNLSGAMLESISLSRVNLAVSKISRDEGKVL